MADSRLAGDGESIADGISELQLSQPNPHENPSTQETLNPEIDHNLDDGALLGLVVVDRILDESGSPRRSL